MLKVFKKNREFYYGMKLGNKLKFLFVFFVFMPLIITGSIIIFSTISNNRADERRKMKNVTEAIKNTIIGEFDYPSSVAQSINKNDYLERFLSEKYETPYDYYVAYKSITSKSILGNNIGMDNARIMIYADNETILNGGEFFQLAPVKMSSWYNVLAKQKSGTCIMFYFDTSKVPYVTPKRKILYMMKLNEKFYSGCERVLKIEIDYQSFVSKMQNLAEDYGIYILCDNKIVFSTTDGNDTTLNYGTFDKKMEDDVEYTASFENYGANFKICIMKKKGMNLAGFLKIIPLIIFFIVIDIILPFFVLSRLERSIVRRINVIEQSFSKVDDEELHKIETIEGSDEIAGLMKNYNKMVDRTNALIQTVYKDKLNEQQMDIARQNAELLALHSQINPHFLFNALESIRMHSILKKEYETADMVECLAIMQRNNTNWGNDMVHIRDEAEFVKAYLELQKYRFGNRLSYEVDIDEECKDVIIPKLTVVTFVENACIHGIEKKSNPGWIFVRAYLEKTDVVIEVEDTGIGMNEEETEAMRVLMLHSSMDNLKNNKHVGIMNACLRLRMMNENVKIRVESEEKTGTMIEIRIPNESLES